MKYKPGDTCWFLEKGQIYLASITDAMYEYRIQRTTRSINPDKYPHKIMSTIKVEKYKIAYKYDKSDTWRNLHEYLHLNVLFDTKEEAAMGLLEQNGIDLSICMKEK
jgi:hypothetical protein